MNPATVRNVATITFADGRKLAVTAEASQVLAAITEAQRGGSDLPAGWIELRSPGDHPVLVQTAHIVYIDG